MIHPLFNPTPDTRQYAWKGLTWLGFRVSGAYPTHPTPLVNLVNPFVFFFSGGSSFAKRFQGCGGHQVLLACVVNTH